MAFGSVLNEHMRKKDGVCTMRSDFKIPLMAFRSFLVFSIPTETSHTYLLYALQEHTLIGQANTTFKVIQATVREEKNLE